MPAKRVSIIIVSWNSRGVLLRCLSALPGGVVAGPDEAIVIDNGSRDGSAAAVRELFPHVKMIENRRNLGYAHANNQGFAIALGEYILLLNPDAELTPDALDKLVSGLETLPRAGAVTARLVGDAGREERYLRAFPDPLTMIVLFTFMRRLLPGLRDRLARRYFLADCDLPTVRTVPQPPGACLLVRRAALEGTLMDEQFPLYFNDVDLCRRLWNGGHRIYMVPDATVRHTPNRGGVSGASPLLEIEHAVGMTRYFRKHCSLPAYVAVRAVLTAHYMGALAVSMARRVARRPKGRIFDRPLASALRGLRNVIACRSYFEPGPPPWG